MRFHTVVIYIVLVINKASGILPDECFTPLTSCAVNDQQYPPYNIYTLRMSVRDCQRICLVQNQNGTRALINGQVKIVYCTVVLYQPPVTCKLYYQTDIPTAGVSTCSASGSFSNIGGSAGGYKSRRSRSSFLFGGNSNTHRRSYQNENPYANGYNQQPTGGGYSNYYGKQQPYSNNNNNNYNNNINSNGPCQCFSAKQNCGGGGGGGGGNSCFEGPKTTELIGNAIANYNNGESGFDGTFAGCQTLCKSNSNCKSLNFYTPVGTDIPANCVLHDATCKSSPGLCLDRSDTQYFDKIC